MLSTYGPIESLVVGNLLRELMSGRVSIFQGRRTAMGSTYQMLRISFSKTAMPSASCSWRSVLVILSSLHLKKVVYFCDLFFRVESLFNGFKRSCNSTDFPKLFVVGTRINELCKQGFVTVLLLSKTQTQTGSLTESRKSNPSHLLT